MSQKYTTTLLGSLLIYVAGFLLIPLIVKTAGVHVYGSHVIVISFLSILTGVSALGTGFLAKRFLPSTDNKKERANVFYPQFYFNILSSFLFLPLGLVPAIGLIVILLFLNLTRISGLAPII